MISMGVGKKYLEMFLEDGRRQTIEHQKREESQGLLEYPDRRIKPVVYTMISSRIRIGAWDFPKWKHANPLYNEKGGIMAAKLIVYANEADRRILFIHYARSIYVTKGLDGLSCVL
jgi:hypothetical protein